MTEHFFTCPYCWQEISFLLDSSVSRQQYIEDCENCCNPIEVSMEFRETELIYFEAKILE